MTKVLVYGIDGAPPELIFGEWLGELPNIKALMEKGCYARINSTIPPATIIAWSAFASGKDASQIGVFGHTIRDEKTNKTHLVNSSHVKTSRIWDILGKHSKKSIILNVPLTYPVKPINGIMVSGFLTPSIESRCAYPEGVKEKIKKLGNTEIYFDVAELAGYKDMDINELLKKTYEMTEMQAGLLKELAANEEWDFLMQVFIGTDRLQHMLWRHFDKTHRRFIKNSPHKNALKDYYKYLDKNLGETLKLLDKDTVVIVTSDHGMTKQEGKININNWLIEKGYLVLKDWFKEEINHNKCKINFEGIDWEKTTAYATGAYHARIFINRKKTEDYEKTREKLIEEIKQIKDDKGSRLKTEIFKAEEIYAEPSNPECPDLTVYFDELRWASNPDFGIKGLHSWETAMGADNAGHSKQGSFVIAGKGIKPKGNIGEVSIYQATPTILKILGVQAPKDIRHEPMGVF